MSAETAERPFKTWGQLDARHTQPPRNLIDRHVRRQKLTVAPDGVLEHAKDYGGAAPSSLTLSADESTLS